MLPPVTTVGDHSRQHTFAVEGCLFLTTSSWSSPSSRTMITLPPTSPTARSIASEAVDHAALSTRFPLSAALTTTGEKMEGPDLLVGDGRGRSSLLRGGEMHEV